MTRNRFSRDLSSFLRKNFSFQLLAISTILFGLNSCYNEPNTIGVGIIPSGDKIKIQIDTTYEVSGYTVKTDSIPTGFFTTAVLGCTNTNVFGRVKADFVAEFALAKASDTLHKINPRPAADSLVLVLRMNRSWGTKNKAISIKVYELSKDIYDTVSGKLYYNGLASVNDIYNPTIVSLPTTYSGDTMLRIRLTDAFANKIMNLPDSAFFKNSKFQKNMKGLYITSDEYNGTDGVFYFFENGDIRKRYRNITLALYHKRIKDGAPIDTVFNYVCSSSPRYIHYEHNYELAARPDLKIKHLNETNLNDTIVQDSVFYIEGFGGVKGLIKLKEATRLRKLMPIAINRAELRIEVQEHAEFPEDSIINPILYYFKRIYSDYYSISTDDRYKLYDYQVTKRDKASYFKAKKYYSIDVTQHLQNIIKNKIKENFFYLEPTDFKSNYRQGIFRTSNNSKPMKLIITYSKL